MADARGKCVVIGIAGLSLELLDTKLREGRLPTLAHEVAAGELRPMVSPIPARSPAAWATLSSGVGPAIHGFVLPEELGPSGLRYAGYASWRAAPFWEQLNQAGLRTASVNWPGLMPGTAWEGAHVDSRLSIARGRTREDWPLPLDVALSSLRNNLRSLRVHPTEIPAQLIDPLDPCPAPSPDTAPRLAVAIARIATLQAAVGATSRDRPWDLLAVYLDWLENVTTAVGSTAETLPDPAWELLDQSLALSIGQAANPSLVILTSISADGPGFVLARGRGFATGRRSSVTSTLAVTPTILAHFGLANPQLVQRLQRDQPALASSPPFQPRASPPNADPADILRLAAFGITITPPHLQWRSVRLLAEAELILADDPTRAAALAEEALTADARSLAALGILATALVMRGDDEALPAIARRIETIDPGHLWADLVHGTYHAMNKDEPAARPHLRRVARDGDLDERLRAGAAWLMLDRRTEAAQLFRGILASQPRHLAALLALLSTETVRGREAEELLRRVLVLDPTNRLARSALANLLRSLGRSVELANLVSRIE